MFSSHKDSIWLGHAECIFNKKKILASLYFTFLRESGLRVSDGALAEAGVMRAHFCRHQGGRSELCTGTD